MPSELHIHMDGQGDVCDLVVYHIDHNGIQVETKIAVEIMKHDKPRTLRVHIGNRTVYARDTDSETYYG